MLTMMTELAVSTSSKLDISEFRSTADSNFSDYFSYCYHVASLYVADQITLATKVMHSSVQFLKVEELTFLPYYHFLNLDELLRLLRVNRSCELAF